MNLTVMLAIALIPQPLRMAVKPGEFSLNRDTVVLVERDSEDAANVGRQLTERLGRTAGIKSESVPSDAAGVVTNSILLTSKGANATLGREGYTLEATPQGVVISATDGAGLFYGMQTLLQLLPPEVFAAEKPAAAIRWQVPVVRIEDKPRFTWRGLMLDSSRHFFTKQEVMRYIDVMAQHKMNIFHWHLVDDPGWRIEIKRYPKLTDFGAWRSETGYGLAPKDTTAYGPDGRYGGFYTQDDIREVLAYAKQRYVTVVPEIEMPGHSMAAVGAYPQYSCDGKPRAPSAKWGQRDGVYCAGNDGTFEFLEGVLTEVMELVPSKYIHIGGDEVEKKHWQACPKCQARIRQEGLRDEKELQSYFVRRIEKFLATKGRTLIGWDEILEGGLAPNATVMSWRGVKGGIDAANAGHDVVMTPNDYYYINFYQADKAHEPLARDRYTPLWKTYMFEPIPAEVAGEKVKHVLGVSGCLWTEWIQNLTIADYMSYPRACAIAESGWSDLRHKNWADFTTRLKTHLKRLKAEGVNYRQPRPTDERPPAK